MASMASTSSCKSASIEMETARSARAAMRPSVSAVWCPRLRSSEMPVKTEG